MAVTSKEPVANRLYRPEPDSLLTLITRSATDPADRAWWAGALLCLALFVRVFWDNLGHFYYAWTTDENYSHGFLVPLISLYFANQAATRGKLPIRGGSWAGSLMLLFALLARLLSIPL